MTRLPTPSSDDGTWGDILNAYLQVSHASDGSLNANIVGTNQIQGNAVTNAKLDSATQATIASVAAKYVKPGSGIPSTDLTSAIQTSLSKADTSEQTTNKGLANGYASLDGSALLPTSQLPGSVVNASTQTIDVRTYGAVGNGTTDDTTAVQNALNAASGKIVVFPGGYNFLISFLTPPTGTTVSAYGATITQVPGTQNAIFYDSGSPPTVKAGFKLLGGTFVGEGTGVTEHQQSAVWLVEWTDIEIRDCTAKNFVSGAFQFRNCQRVQVLNNTVRSCCHNGGRNAININDSAGSSTNYTEDVLIDGNYVDGCPTAPICVSLAYLNNSSAPARVIITNNDVQATFGFAGIALEIGTSTTTPFIQQCIIADNKVRFSGPVSGAFGITVDNSSGASDSADQTIFEDLIITGNQITSTDHGIAVQAARCIIADNIIDCATGSGIFVQGHDPSHVQLLPYITIADNIVHSLVNPTASLVWVSSAQHVLMQGNQILCDSGNTSGPSAVFLQNSSFLTVTDNVIEYAPGDGINVSSGQDFTIARNRIYNPNDISGTGTGIKLSTAQTGTINLILGNEIVDNRGTHRMVYGINNATGSSTGLYASDNFLFGYATAATTGAFAESVQNRTTGNPTLTAPVLSAALVTSSNASWPIPSGATMLEVTAIGGGGGGGGGGSSSAIAGQAGGAGGSAGVFSTQVVAVGANTTLNVTIGGGGNAGTSGTSGGNAGTDGGYGGATTVTATGISVRGDVGGKGRGSAANSSSQVGPVAFGGGTVGQVANLQIAGNGGFSGNQGGAALGYTGAGGGGGGISTATNGGNGGNAGTATLGGTGGSAGGSASATGGDGVTAAANTGAGGGAGGGGSWNGGGGAQGAGGNGGVGGSGLAIIRVVG